MHKVNLDLVVEISPTGQGASGGARKGFCISHAGSLKSRFSYRAGHPTTTITTITDIATTITNNITPIIDIVTTITTTTTITIISTITTNTTISLLQQDSMKSVDSRESPEKKPPRSKCFGPVTPDTLGHDSQMPPCYHFFSWVACQGFEPAYIILNWLRIWRLTTSAN
ncbi:hypothetical protein PoB_003806700 [Plakobranchus ocellatus]|uniref:Uncharacterized protein n=1 Tax=Plakobranchus ocellatus TaxID=259542 RepID=A0AAV4AWY4_9GAST|nr:hypothetical protein PoB_003806700 [Plakobranchus ocellatus]